MRNSIMKPPGNLDNQNKGSFNELETDKKMYSQVNQKTSAIVDYEKYYSTHDRKQSQRDGTNKENP